MTEPVTFTAPIEQAAGGGAFVRIPFDVEATYGRKRVPVHATIDGVPYRGSLVRMGTDCHILGVLKEIREQLGKQPGDSVAITLVEDEEERSVEVPEDFLAALAEAPTAAAFFETLSYSRKREYVLWIAGAKREQTRADHVTRAVALLADGKRLR